VGEDLAVVVLAGGASTRLGAFKPTVPFMGRPLIDHALSIACRSSRNIYVLVNSTEQGARIDQVANLRGARIILDHHETGVFPNPLIRSVRQLNHNLIFLMGCDMPFLDHRLPYLLLGKMGRFGAAIPSWPNGFVEPLTALYRRSCFPSTTVLSLRELVGVMGAVLIPVCELGLDRESFFNINTREDLLMAEGMAQTRSIST
jgi:molybdopterin-guanine dinucleotide biosynthesis protein A